MITITNYNQQTPNFQARMKMSQASEKIGHYMKNKGINPTTALLASAGAAGVAGSVTMFSPDMVSAPDAAKYWLFGAMASTLGSMGFSAFKKSRNAESVPEQEAADKTETVQTETVQAKEVKSEVKTNSEDKSLFEVKDTPVGTIKLSKKGKDIYLKCAENYAMGTGKIEYYGKGNTIEGVIMVTEATLQMEILKSLHELSTRHNNQISSKTFGTFNVTDKGIKDYLDAIKDYSIGTGKIAYYGKGNTVDGNRLVSSAQERINIIKAFGEL